MSRYDPAISLLFPSRQRPHRAKEMIQSVEDTANSPADVEVLIYVDVNDPTIMSYLDLQCNNYAPVTRLVLTGVQWTYLSGTYNFLYRRCRGEIIGYMADDVTFATKGWDTVVREKFSKGQTPLVSDSENPSDPNNVPMHGFLSRRACDALWYVTPIWFEHGYVDHWLLDVYRQAGMPVIFTNEYRIDHHHFSPEPDKMDEVYKKRSLVRDFDGRTCDDRDKLIYDSKWECRRQDALRLRLLKEYR